jgi:hypothetical protein
MLLFEFKLAQLKKAWQSSTFILNLDQGIHKQIIETTTIFFAQGDRYPLITRSTYFVYLYMFISLISLVIIPYIYEMLLFEFKLAQLKKAWQSSEKQIYFEYVVSTYFDVNLAVFVLNSSKQI